MSFSFFEKEHLKKMADARCGQTWDLILGGEKLTLEARDFTLREAWTTV